MQLHRLTNATESSHNIVSQPTVRRTPSSHKCNSIVSQTQLNRLTYATKSSHKRDFFESSHKRKFIVSQTKVHRLTNASSSNCIVSQTLVHPNCIVSQTLVLRPCAPSGRRGRQFGLPAAFQRRPFGLQRLPSSCPGAVVTSSDFLRRSSTDNALCCGLNVEPLFFRSEEHTTSSEPPFREYIGHCPP